MIYISSEIEICEMFYFGSGASFRLHRSLGQSNLQHGPKSVGLFSFKKQFLQYYSFIF